MNFVKLEINFKVKIHAVSQFKGAKCVEKWACCSIKWLQSYILEICEIIITEIIVIFIIYPLNLSLHLNLEH